MNIVRVRRVIWFNSHSILARWRKPFSQLLNAYGVHNVRQTEIHTAESLVPELSASEAEMAIRKLNTNHQLLIKSQQNLLKQS